MRRIVDNLWSKRRSVVSDDYKESLDLINTKLAINKYKVKSGEKILDWTVPKKWTLNDAYIEFDGEKVFNAMEHPLNVLVGSASVDTMLPVQQLLDFIYIDTNNPLSIPYVYEHYNTENRWGLCMSSTDVNALMQLVQGGEVRVVIDAVHEDGEMLIGEYVKRGSSSDSIALFAHLDHPGMMQDGLSGCAVLAEFGDRILDQMKDNYYTYRILFFPETLGSLAYFSMFPKRIEDIKFGVCLEMVGVPNQDLVVQDAFVSDTEIANALEVAVKDVTGNDEVLFPYRSIVVNDDGVFNSPGIEIPTVSLTRSASRDILKSDHFRGYHSSSDDINNVSWEGMYETLAVVGYLVNILETNRTIKRQYTGTPNLSAHDLWVPRAQDPHLNKITKDVVDALRGEVTTLEVAKMIGAKYQPVAQYIGLMEKKGLVKTRRKSVGGRVISV